MAAKSRSIADTLLDLGLGLKSGTESLIGGAAAGLAVGQEAIESGVNKVARRKVFDGDATSLRGIATSLAEQADATNAARSEEGRRLAADATPTGNLLEGEFGIKNFTAEGFAQAATPSLPSTIIPLGAGLLAGAATRSPKVGSAVAAALGGLTGGGFAAQEEGKRVREMTPEQLRALGGFDQAGDEAAQREELARRAELASGLAAGTIAGAGSILPLKFFSAPAQQALGKVVGTGIGGRAAATGVVGAVEEGVQEVAEGLAQRGASAIAIGDDTREIGEESAANALLGAAVGGPVAATSALIKPAPPGVIEPSRGAISRAAAKGVESGAVTGAVVSQPVAAQPAAQPAPEVDGALDPPAAPSPAVSNPGSTWQVGEADIVRFPGLSEPQREVETRAWMKVLENPDAMAAAYRQIKDADGGRIINTDLARELFEDYNAGPDARSANAAAVHEPSSIVAKRVLAESLAEQPSGDDAFVLFTGGGTGAGKTTGIKRMPELKAAYDMADFIFDGNLQNADRAASSIERVKQSGRKAHVIYTFRDPAQAWRSGTLPRASREDYGRTVPANVQASTHIGAAKTALQLLNTYANDPSVKLDMVYNSFDVNDKGNSFVRPATIEDIEAIASMDEGALTQELLNVLEEEYQAGRIPERVYLGTLPQQAEGAGRVQQVQGLDAAAVPGREADPNQGRLSGGPVGRAAGLAGGAARAAVAPPVEATAGAGGASPAAERGAAAPVGVAGPEAGQGLGGGGIGDAGAVGPAGAVPSAAIAQPGIQPAANLGDGRALGARAAGDLGDGTLPGAAPGVQGAGSGVPGQGQAVQASPVADGNDNLIQREPGREGLAAEGIPRDGGGAPQGDAGLRTAGAQAVAGPAGVPLAVNEQEAGVGEGPGSLAQRSREAAEAARAGAAGAQFLGVSGARPTDVTKLPRDRDRFAVSGLPKPRGGGQSVEPITLDRAFDLAKSRTFARGRDLKMALQEASLAAQKAARLDLSQVNQRTLDVLSGAVAADARYALQSSSSAVGWYDRKVSQAMEILSLIHPELRTDQKSRLAFKWALAVTSNGMKVDKNFELAESAYTTWKRTGEMPTSIGIGNAATAINEGMRLFNHLNARMTSKQLESFMSTEFTVGEITKAIGVKPGGEWTDTPVRGAAILGPKIGNGFFSNLTGRFDSLTMDRWLMRTWGRLTGTLIDVDPKVIADGRRQLAIAVAKLTPAERAKLVSLVGGDGKTNTNDATDALALAINKASQKTDKRAEMQSSPRLDSVRKAGNSLTMKLDGSKEAPAGPGERMWIRTVFGRALDTMRAETGDMTMADLQALVWYPEKRLYDQAKAKDEVDDYNDDDAPDYANAAAALAKENGISPAAIKRALQAGESNRVPLSPEMDAEAKAAFLRRTKAPPEQESKLSFEVAPDPNDAEATAAWNALPQAQKRKLTVSIGKATAARVSALLGVKIGNPVGGTGGYQGQSNPNLYAELSQAKVSVADARAVAAAIGIALDQDAVALADARSESKIGVVRLTSDTSIAGELDALIDAAYQAEPGIWGFSARDKYVDILIDPEADIDSIADAIEAVVSSVSNSVGVSSAVINSELMMRNADDGRSGYEQAIKAARPADSARLGRELEQLRDENRAALAAALRPDGAGAARRAAKPRLGKAAAGQAEEGLDRRDQWSPPAAVTKSRIYSAADGDEKAFVNKQLKRLTKAGYPKAWIDRVPFFFTHNNLETFRARFYTNGELKGSVSVRESNFDDADGLMADLAHELAHAADYDKGVEGFHSESSPLFAITERNGKMSYTGEVISELHEQWASNGPLSEVLAYPFDSLYEYDAKTQKVEAFAQSVMLYFSNRDALRKYAPNTFKFVEGMINAESTGNEKASGDGQAVSRAVREALRSPALNVFATGAPHGRVPQGDPAVAGERRGEPKAQGGKQRSRAVGSAQVRSQKPFYSALLRAIETGQGAPKKADAAAWKGWLDGAQRRGEIKKSERDWIGIDAWLDSQQGATSRQQLVDFVRANEVQVQDVVLGADKAREDRVYDDAFANAIRERVGNRRQVTPEDDAAIDRFFAQEIDEDDLAAELRIQRLWIDDAADQAERETAGAQGSSKFGGYVVPGGQNYRELLLTLPATMGTDAARLAELNALIGAKTAGYDAMSEDDRRLVRAEVKAWRDERTAIENRKVSYKSSHWQETPNVLAHVRFDERLDDDGRRVLFLQEVQSDWHQAGRKKGYAATNAKTAADAKALGYAVYKAASNLGTGAFFVRGPENYRDITSSGFNTEKEAFEWAIGHIEKHLVPSAPFKQTDEWAMLAFKRMARWAVDNDFDRIAWVTGEQAAEMFDLSKQVDSIGVVPRDDGDRTISIVMAGNAGYESMRVNSGGIVTTGNFSGKPLDEVIGKEMAEKAMAVESMREFTGDGLKIGGAGMRGFYDKILPAAVNKWGKRFGVKAEILRMSGQDKDAANDLYRQGYTEEQVEERLGPEDDFTANAITITPAMRDAVLGGQSLFRRDAPLDTRGVDSMGPPPVASAFEGVTLPSWELRDHLRDTATTRIDAYKGAAAAGGDKLRTIFQDYFLPIRRAQEAVQAAGGAVNEASDVYGKEELYYGRTGEQLRKLEDNHVKPLVKAMVDAKVEQADLELYLYAKFAPARNARIAGINPKFPDGGSGMTNADAAQILADFDQAGMTNRLEALAKRVRALNDIRMDALEAGGLLSAEELQMWRSEPNYVPLKGLADPDPDEPTRLRTGGGFSVGGREAHRALGRRSRATDILANTVAQTEQAIIRAEKNRVAQALLKLARDNPNEELWAVDATEFRPSFDKRTGEVTYNRAVEPDAVLVKVNGKEHRVVLRDKRLLEAMKNMGAAKTGAFLRAFASVNRFLSLTRTMLAPEFVLANFSRDLQTAGVNLTGDASAEMALKVTKDVPVALRAMYGHLRGKTPQGEWSRWAKEFTDAGGMTSFVAQRTVEEQQSSIESHLKRAKGGTAASIIGLASDTLKFVEHVNGAVENAVRLSAYANARRSGSSSTEAARIAKNLTVNFNRKGQVGPVLNSLYLFYNASIQGTQRFLRAMRSPAVQGIMASTAVLGYAMAMWNRSMGGEDDDGEDKWDKIPEWEKARNLIFMTPGGKLIKVPLPYSYNLPFLIGQQMEGVVNGRTKPSTAAASMAEAILTSFNPIGDIDLKGDSAVAAAKLAAPSAIDPFLDIAVNRNFFGGPIAPEQNPFAKVKAPDSEMYFGATNPAAVWIAKMLNQATGGDEIRPGAIDVSPASMVYVFDYLTGGTGGFVERTATAAMLTLQGEAVPPGKIPFSRVFFNELSDRRAADTFYRIRDDVNIKAEMAERGGYTDEEDVTSVRIGRVLAPQLKAAERRLRALREQRKRAEGNDDRIKLIKEQELKVQARFNRAYFSALERFGG